jgi:hypothetical protein
MVMPSIAAYKHEQADISNKGVLHANISIFNPNSVTFLFLKWWWHKTMAILILIYWGRFNKRDLNLILLGNNLLLDENFIFFNT